MDTNKIDPELRLISRLVPPLPLHYPIARAVSKLSMALYPNPKSVNGVPLTILDLGPIQLRLFMPTSKKKRAALLWIHGGGYMLGAAAMDDKSCADFAKNHDLAIVSVDYRLAPTHPFPTPLDDCFYAWQWLQQNAKDLGVNPERVLIGGQSAGGGLAAALAQRIYDSAETQPIGQVLLCPMLDDRTAIRPDIKPRQHKFWNKNNTYGGWQAYLSQDPGASQTPEYAVPARRENLGGLAPAWIGVGDVDLFFDESKFYSERLQQANVPCHFEVAAGGPHGFERLRPLATISRRYMDSCNQFIQQVLKGDCHATNQTKRDA